MNVEEDRWFFIRTSNLDDFTERIESLSQKDKNQYLVDTLDLFDVGYEYEKLTIILQNGGDVNQLNGDGYSLLHSCIHYADYRSFKKILSYHPDLRLKEPQGGRDVIDFAIYYYIDSINTPCKYPTETIRSLCPCNYCYELGKNTKILIYLQNYIKEKTLFMMLFIKLNCNKKQRVY